ncbi:hypothetical protein C0989_001866 [Termitomyces sp. Mn162]|nr:hypothetical protein C0989_001866 [Termitomyces sp. Mn162]
MVLSKAYGQLEKENPVLHSENSMLRAHCAFAGSEIQELNQHLNAKENRPQKQHKLNVNARWLNSDEGLRLAEEQEAAWAAEEQKKHEAREQQAAKETEREQQQQQRDSNAAFSGTLGLKTKADLQNVAQALGLTTDGKKKDLLT